MESKLKDYDYIVIGSGFGGSVSALRLSEKGYKVLVIEKGRKFEAADFPKSNWNLKRWLWMPVFRFFGFFKITFHKHVAILSGVGVGGGSLVYANTLPIPKSNFFNADSWANLADWENELKPHYAEAKRMLGVSQNPILQKGDIALKKIAQKYGKEGGFSPTDVAVFFGEPEVKVADPYFGGEGPEREGCQFCGACMIGCRYNAKNTLDKNYLFFAQKNDVEIISESKVFDVFPLDKNTGSTGYKVAWKSSTGIFASRNEATTKGIVFAGGVLGTVPLLLKLKTSSLKKLSSKVGNGIRTNSESLLGITSTKKDAVFSDGIAIGSILNIDEHSNVEPVRYPAGSGFWRLQMVPMLEGKNWLLRFLKIFYYILKQPIKWMKIYFVGDWAKKTQILLFMQTINSTLKFEKGLFRMKSKLEDGNAPTAFMPEARKLARDYASMIDGTPTSLLTETVFGIPTTAHILGGSIMGNNIDEGVIDKNNKVFNYENMFVCDGSAISANPGVNPSLTITALTERAMSKIKRKV